MKKYFLLLLAFFLIPIFAEEAESSDTNFCNHCGLKKIQNFIDSEKSDFAFANIAAYGIMAYLESAILLKILIKHGVLEEKFFDNFFIIIFASIITTVGLFNNFFVWLLLRKKYKKYCQCKLTNG